MRGFVCLFLVAGLCLAGCVSHTTAPIAGSPTAKLSVGSDSPASTFDYNQIPIIFKNDVLDEEETKYYLVRHIEFPSIGDNRQRNDLVTGRYYEGKKPGKKPVVIILPIFGGHVYPPRNMTLFLKRVSDGEINVFLMEGEQNLTDWWRLKHAPDQETFMELWKSTSQAEFNTIIDIRRTIDWAIARPEVDPDRVALIGFSRGAIMAAVASAHDDRLAATVLVMGGAHPHKALASCPMLRGVGVQGKVQKEYGWTLEEFADRLEPFYLDLDPANFAGQTDPERVLIVEAAEDDCIAAEAREALWLATGQPERILIPYGHKKAFLSMTPVGGKWLQKDIWSFLQRSF